MATIPTHQNHLWQNFRNRARNVGYTIRDTGNTVGNRWRESSTLTKVCIVAPAAALVAPLAILPALSVVGFTSAGVAAGSIAAAIQTATTVSGSVFALCQSAAATGVVAASTTAGVSLTAGVTVGSITAAIFKRRTVEQNSGDQPQVEVEEEEEDVQEDDDEH